MKIGIIGLGKLGLPLAIAIDYKGHEVYGYDIDKNRMQKDWFRELEQGVDGKSIEIMLAESNINFVEMKDVVSRSDLIFVCVNTPSGSGYDGTQKLKYRFHVKDYDKKALFSVCESLSKFDLKGKSIVIVSTVLPGTTRTEIIPRIKQDKLKVYFIPAFCAMGTVLRDFYNPEFTVVGSSSNDNDIIIDFYKTIMPDMARLFFTDYDSAEFIKTCYNAFITTKVNYANMIMEMVHKHGAGNVDSIMKVLQSADRRLISKAYLNAGGPDGGCLDETQYIHAEDGLRLITEIKEGERVLSHDGKLHKVNHLFNREYEGDLIEIKCRGLLPIRLTSNHKIITAKAGNGKGIISEEVSDRYDLASGELTMDNYMCFPVVKNNKIEMPEYADKTYIQLAGYYLSNGHVGMSNRSFCRFGITHGTHKKEDINQCVELIKRISKNKIRISTKHEGNTATDIVVHDKSLVDKIFYDFNKGALNKKVPGWLLYGNLENIKLLLKGIFRGDGCFSVDTYFLSTISRNLCYNVDFMLKRLGVLCTIRKQTSKKKNEHDLYQVMVSSVKYYDLMKEITGIDYFAGKKRGMESIFEKDGFIYHRITKIKRIPFKGKVYNIEVDKANTYTTLCGSVNNSCHPKENISLAYFAEKLGMKTNYFYELMSHREWQVKFIAELAKKEKDENGLSIVIMGEAFKANTNILDGSGSLLLQEILKEENISFDVFDPFTENNKLELSTEDNHIFIIMTNHDVFKNSQDIYKVGDVVIDPWGIIKSIEGVKVVSVGRCLSNG